MDKTQRGYTDCETFQIGYAGEIRVPKLKVQHYEIPTQGALERLRTLMPHDIWIYNYAKSVFNARYSYYKTGKYTKPVKPSFSLPPSCLSSFYFLRCFSGPYSNRFWTAQEMPASHRRKFEKFLNKNK